MGHDIDIIEGGCKIDRIHITGNFSGFNPNIHQLHGHSGKVIAPFLERKLERLKKRGIEPRDDLGVDGWGGYKKDFDFGDRNSWQDFKEKVPEAVHAINCMHAYHMSRFLKMAKKYPSAYWYSDQIETIQILDGDEGKYRESSEDEEEIECLVNVKDLKDAEITEDDDGGFIIPMEQTNLIQGLFGIKKNEGVVYSFRHPINGIKTIKTWQDAMEVAQIAVEDGDLRATSWTMMALIIKKMTLKK